MSRHTDNFSSFSQKYENSMGFNKQNSPDPLSSALIDEALKEETEEEKALALAKEEAMKGYTPEQVEMFEKLAGNHFFTGINLRKNMIFADVFEVFYIDRHGKKFDRVSRLEARSKNFNIDMVLDYHSELIHMMIGAKLAIVLSWNLDKDGQFETDTSKYLEAPAYDPSENTSMADSFSYVAHGKIYKYIEKGLKGIIHISFGGLLMSLEGDPVRLKHVKTNHYVYLCMDHYSDVKAQEEKKAMLALRNQILGLS